MLYYRKAAWGFGQPAIIPFAFARASDDPRLAKLDKLMPLGMARNPTARERQMIDLAEPKLLDQTGSIDLAHFTRIYGRTSTSGLAVFMFRSVRPRLLVVDDPTEFPTAKSCRCDPKEISLNLQDLWDAGKLPPFP